MAQARSRLSYRSSSSSPLRSRRRGNRRGSPQRGRGNRSSYGINGRRDKRWPFYAERPERVAANSTAETLPAIAHSLTELEKSEETVADTAVSSRALDPVTDKALGLWLQWNEAYEKVTACMFQPGSGNDQQLEDMIDQLDQLRLRAVKLSAKLVG